MKFFEAFTDEIEKTAARGSQSAKLLSLLRIKGDNPYTSQSLRAITKARSSGGLARGSGEAREAAKTIRAMRKRTVIDHPGRYEQILHRQLNLPGKPKMKRRTRRIGE